MITIFMNNSIATD